MKPPVMILKTSGTNRDGETAWACELAGGAPEIVHMNDVLSGNRNLMDYRMVVLPGGFSYGDDLGAGRLWAATFRLKMAHRLLEFVDAGRPMLGICNGFQVLVKLGLLPGPFLVQTVTLAPNLSGRFECRWVALKSAESPCVFTAGIDHICCPVAHGEGRFIARDERVLESLQVQKLVALRYSSTDGPVTYPHNPNGSQDDIAGICNYSGTVLGMMPHPEDHVIREQHPQRKEGGLGLVIFQNGIRYAAQL